MSKNKQMTLWRSVVLERGSVDPETRTVGLAFSSETEYERYDPKYGRYLEVLGHSENEIDLSFLGSGRAPLLRDHDQLKQIGVVESVVISEGRGRASVKLSQNEEGQNELTDIVDGIRQNVSVGYYIEQEKIVGERDGKKIVRATRWRPVEISTVSIPADETVGIGRASGEADEEITTTPNEERKMTIENTHTDLEAVKAEARKAEQARVRDISALGQKFNLSREADSAIKGDISVDAFRAMVLEKVEGASKQTETKASAPQDLGLSNAEVKNFSFVRAIRSQIDPEFARKEGGFEMAVSRAYAEKNGYNPRGIMVPYEVLTRGLEAGGASNGANFVQTTVDAGNFIELLRSQTMVVALGAKLLTNLKGPVALPRQTGGATAYWVAEGVAPTTSVQTMDQLTLSPKHLGAYTDISRSLLIQSTPDVEAFVRNDLASTLAIAIDKAALYGNTSGSPVGIANVSSVSTIDIPANAPTYANVVTMEALVSGNNALSGALAYLAAPNVRGNMKTTTVAANTGTMIWGADNKVNGYRAEASSIVTAGDIFFGNWNDLIIGMFGALDITVDPYALSTSGGIRVVALQSVDVGARHARSFVYGV